MFVEAELVALGVVKLLLLTGGPSKLDRVGFWSIL